MASSRKGANGRRAHTQGRRGGRRRGEIWEHGRQVIGVPETSSAGASMALLPPQTSSARALRMWLVLGTMLTFKRGVEDLLGFVSLQGLLGGRL